MRRLSLVTLLAMALIAPVRAQQPTQLSLAAALARADSASPAVGIARAGINSAQAAWLRTRSAYLPQINGTALYTRTLASEFSGFATSNPADTFPAPVNCHHFVANPDLTVPQRLDSLEHALDCTANGSGSLDLSQLPFGRPNTWTFSLAGSQVLFNKQLANQIAAASALRDQSQVELDAQRAAAVVTVAQAYFDAELAQRLVDIADSTLVQAQRTFDQTRLERQAGNAAEFDQLRAGVARDNQTPIVIQRRAQRDQAFLRLRQALDLPGSVTLVLTTALTDTSAITLPSYAAAIAAANDTSIESRAPVREAAATLRSTESALRAAHSEHLPTIGISSTYSKIAFPIDVFSLNHFVTDWSVNVQLSVPIFNGGRLHADAMAAEATREQSAQRLRQARQQAQLEQGDARTQLLSASAASSASIGTVTQAQRAYDIAELRYRNGLSTLTDLGDARVQLGQAQANNAQAARDLQVARLRLALLRDLPFSNAQSAPAVAGQGTSAPAGAIPQTTSPTGSATRTGGVGGTTGGN
jgi:outer membrane protein TolC